MSTQPAVEEDLWLEPADIEVIASAVTEMVRRVRRGDPPMKPGVPLSLLGARLHAATPGAPEPRAIRAGTHFSIFGTCTIDLSPFPINASDIGPLQADLTEFETAMLGLLAHEASHVRQREGGERTSAMHQASERASQRAWRTKLYDDYIAYLETPLETAAHATQLAVELRHLHGPDLPSGSFLRLCRASPIWMHMSNHPDCPPTSPAAGRKAFGPVSRRLLWNAWWVYLRLTNRPPPWRPRAWRWLVDRLP